MDPKTLLTYDVLCNVLQFTEAQFQSLRTTEIKSILCFAKKCYVPSVNVRKDGSSYIGCEKQERFEGAQWLPKRCPPYTQQEFRVRKLLHLLNLEEVKRMILHDEDTRSRRIQLHAYVTMLMDIVSRLAVRSSEATLHLMPPDKFKRSPNKEALCKNCELLARKKQDEALYESMKDYRKRKALTRVPTLFPTDKEHEEKRRKNPND